MYDIHREELHNGMKIILIPMNNTEIVSVGIFVKTGSRYENKKNNGIAHFLEHMMFKGTKNMSSEELSVKLDSVGAKYNAETSYDQTCYYLYGHYKEYKLFINIISDIYLNPVFDKADIKTEKGVVVEELNMFHDDPSEIIHDLMCSTMFPNSSLSLPIIGTKKTILNISQKDLFKFRNEFYIPERTVFVVTGNIDTKKVSHLIKHNFKNLKKSNNIISFPYNEPKLQSEPFIKIIKKPISQTVVSLVFRTESVYSKNEVVYDLICDLLCAGISSRLYVLLRTKLGAIYSVNAYNMSFEKEGILTINIGVDNKRIDEMLVNVLKELNDLKNNGIDLDELKKIKKIRMTSFSLNIQTPQDVLSYCGNQEILYNIDNVKKDYKFKLNIKENLNSYLDVKLSDFNTVLHHIFDKSNLNIFIYGNSPIKKIKTKK